MNAYVVGICGYDMNDVRYVTLSLPKAKDLFEELRTELIDQCKKMIEHIEKDDDCKWDIENWENDIMELTNMSPGDDVGCDRPYIEVFTITW